MTNRLAFSVALVGLALAGCSARPVESGSAGETATAACTRCHGGTDNATGAPPHDVTGHTETSRVTVGAHTSHVAGSHGISVPLGCEACHVAPSASNPASHVDGEATVSLGVLANANGAAARWDAATATCTAYCHGATLAGGIDTRPSWTRVDGQQASCYSCHGYPPPAPHPARTDCATCHPDTFASDGTLEPARHVNGKVDLAQSCTICHGDSSRVGPYELASAAPPVGLSGETDTSTRAVGAHQSHVMGGDLAGPIACAQCHEVPTDPGHADGKVDVAFGDVASKGTVARWDAAAGTCATYCHGATLGGGSLTSPSWTKVDGTQAACGTCHGAPPPSHDPRSTQCSTCHPHTVKADGTIDVAGGLHVNGQVDVSDVHPDGWIVPTAHGYAANRDLWSCKQCHGEDLAGGITGISCDKCHTGGTPAWRTTCTFCHGDGNRAQNKPAPPVGTQGQLDTASRAVGAHQAHLAGGKVRSGVACEECHQVPTDISHVTGKVELTFGALATANGATPVLGADGTCASTYCHGAKLAIGGGSNVTPLWTKVDGTQAACGTCHGNPPPAPHTKLTTCKQCHPETMATDTTIDLAGGKHIDGIVQKQGYHPEGWSDPLQHGLAANRGLDGCKSCHGDDLAGGNVGIACAACHGEGWQSNCTFCHGQHLSAYAPADLPKAAPPFGTQNETATTSTAVGAHASHVFASAISPAFACGECHTTPVDLTHVNGTAAVSFGALATTGSLAPQWTGGTCSATYCHGGTVAGGSTKTPTWTMVDGSQAQCGSCHGAPPATVRGGSSPHPTNKNCGGCHGDGYSSTTANPATHVNGKVDIGAMTCTSCHGDATKQASPQSPLYAAPPVDTAGNPSSPAVGAHQKHLDPAGAAVACTQCHPVPQDLVTHPNGGGAEIQWGTLATGEVTPIVNTNPDFSGFLPTAPKYVSGTCASTYCHGSYSGTFRYPILGSDPVEYQTITYAGNAATATWSGSAPCGSCHGIPPSAVGAWHSGNHPGGDDCSLCHPDASGTGTAAVVTKPGLHVDGKIDLQPKWTAGCLKCH